MNTIVVGYDNQPPCVAALEWAAAHARCTDGELLGRVHRIVDSRMGARRRQINPDPIRREFERRLRDEWTAPLRKAHVGFRTTFLVDLSLTNSCKSTRGARNTDCHRHDRSRHTRRARVREYATPASSPCGAAGRRRAGELERTRLTLSFLPRTASSRRVVIHRCSTPRNVSRA